MRRATDVLRCPTLENPTESGIQTIFEGVTVTLAQVHILKVKDYLNFTVEQSAPRKTISKSYSESQFLCDPAKNVHEA